MYWYKSHNDVYFQVFIDRIKLQVDTRPNVVKRISKGAFLISNELPLIPGCCYKQVNWMKQRAPVLPYSATFQQLWDTLGLELFKSVQQLNIV